MSQTDARRRVRSRLQEHVLKRLESGLPPTHWQQFRLHFHTAWRQRRKPSFQRLAFHLGGLMRVFWKPVTISRVSGVPIQFHLTCLIHPCGLVALLDWRSHPKRIAIQVVLVALLIGSGLVVHELGHALVARRMGVAARRIVLIPFGAFVELETIPNSRCELAIASAGPLASLALAGGFWLMLAVIEMIHAPWTYLPRTFCALGCAANLALALFNLLPCFPMDGGRILRSLLAMFIGKASGLDRSQARLIATQIAVRYVAWLAAAGMIVLTITVTHLWIHLLLFPLLLVVAEIEYWLIRVDVHSRTNGLETICNRCHSTDEP